MYCLCRSSSCVNSSFNLLHSSFKSSSFAILFHFMKHARVDGLAYECLVSFRKYSFITETNCKSRFNLQSELNKTVLRQESVKYNLYTYIPPTSGILSFCRMIAPIKAQARARKDKTPSKLGLHRVGKCTQIYSNRESPGLASSIVRIRGDESISLTDQGASDGKKDG